MRSILNALPAMVGYWDRDLRNVLANDAYVEYFGMSPEQMRGMHIKDLLGPELYAKNRPYMERALSGEQQVFDRAIPTPSGELRYTQASYIPDVVDGEVAGFFVLVTDITERRRIEEEVERSRTRLAEAEHVARMGSWEWDIANNRVTWSDGLFELYGVRRADFEGRYRPGGSKYVHPADRERVEAAVRRTVETGEPIDFEYRIVRPDGRVRRLRSRAEVVVDADGNPVHLIGTAQDVSELRAPENGAGRAELAHLLTPRQHEILQLVSQGLSNGDIAGRLFLTEATVKWHVRKILRALGVANRAQAVARYLER